MYVDAFFDRQRDRIHIVERDKNQNRQYQEHQAKYIMYYDDPKGKFKSIYGNPVSRIQCRSSKDFRREKALHVNVKTYESDMNPVFRCLEENYLGQDAPKLQVAFFDIEVDFDKDKGFSPPEDPFNPVTAISVYLQWCDQLVTLLTPPRQMAKEEVDRISSKFDNTFVFEKEEDLIELDYANSVSNGICLIEWANNFLNALPKNRIEINIDLISHNKRSIKFKFIGNTKKKELMWAQD